MWRLWFLLVCLLPSLAWAAPRLTEDLLPMGEHQPGTAQSSDMPVWPGDRFVTLRLDRSAWTVEAGIIRLSVEAETGGVWREIKTQETRGKAVGTAAPSAMFISIPAGATHIRVKSLMGGPPGVYRIWMEVGP